MISTVRQLGRMLLNSSILMTENCIVPTIQNSKGVRNVHITSSLARDIRSKEGHRIVIRTDKTQPIEMTSSIITRHNVFPTEDTPTTLYDGIEYCKLPVIHLKATKNNTTYSLSNYDGKVQIIHSSGIEGFKHCKKGTGTAAQQAAITFGTRCRRSGVTSVKVVVQGFGQGRMNGCLGLQMTGLKIVSITDATRVSPNPPRRRKARRL